MERKLKISHKVLAYTPNNTKRQKILIFNLFQFKCICKQNLVYSLQCLLLFCCVCGWIENEKRKKFVLNNLFFFLNAIFPLIHISIIIFLRLLLSFLPLLLRIWYGEIDFLFIHSNNISIICLSTAFQLIQNDTVRYGVAYNGNWTSNLEENAERKSIIKLFHIIHFTWSSLMGWYPIRSDLIRSNRILYLVWHRLCVCVCLYSSHTPIQLKRKFLLMGLFFRIVNFEKCLNNLCEIEFSSICLIFRRRKGNRKGNSNYNCFSFVLELIVLSLV